MIAVGVCPLFGGMLRSNVGCRRRWSVDEPHLPYTLEELPEPPNENKWENK
jgi:hypothetical protein